MLVFHHAIYSPAAHANDGDNKQRRLDFPTAFSNLGVDLVLEGHDHSYSRSYALKNGQKANASEQPGAAQVATGPGGVIYVTGNSASGSKYYDLSTPVAGSDFGPDPLDPTGKRHFANSVENQEHVRTYVKVQVRKDALVVENIRSGTCAAPNAAVEPATCRGAARTAAPARRSRSAPWSTRSCIHAAEAPPVGAPVGGVRPGDARADARHAGRVRPVHARHREGLHGLHHRHGRLDRGRRDADRLATRARPRPAAWSTGRSPWPRRCRSRARRCRRRSRRYAAPVSNDNVTIDFKQPIAANEPLRTGTYAKTLTFTLSTTNP